MGMSAFLHGHVHGARALSRYDCRLCRPYPLSGDHLAAERQVGESASPRRDAGSSIAQNPCRIKRFLGDQGDSWIPLL